MSRGSRRGLRASIALVAIGGCLTAAAYATTRHGTAPSAPRGAGAAARTAVPGAASSGPKTQARPPKPSISAHPATETISTRARFAFTDRQPGVRFSCRLDRAPWRACRPPIVVNKLALGRHSFAVRALNRQGTPSRPAKFRWSRLEAKDFSIAPDLSGLSALYPGAPPIALPLTVKNPNGMRILVTDLRVSVVADPSGCASAENLTLSQSSVSSSAPLRVPADGSVQVPAAGVSAPTIQLRNLPVNQDACQGARFPLEFTGSAHG